MLLLQFSGKLNKMQLQKQTYLAAWEALPLPCPHPSISHPPQAHPSSWQLFLISSHCVWKDAVNNLLLFISHVFAFLHKQTICCSLRTRSVPFLSLYPQQLGRILYIVLVDEDAYACF